MEELDYMYAIAACIYIKKRKPKSKWQKGWLADRKRMSHVNLVKQLSLEPSDWHNYLRMDESTYNTLLNLITPFIQKKDTNMRQAITPHEKLTATLRYLASGCSYEELKFPTAISPQALGRIIPDTCRAIVLCLQDYLKFPTTAQEWKTTAEKFERRWNFPHCLGAWDGKHIRINPPPGSGSFFYNYKHFHSVVLMACVNADYEFIWVDVGTNGRISDGGVIRNTEFYKQLENGELNLPPPETLSNSKTNLPYVFVGDEAFALRTDFMKPYSQQVLTKQRRIFNYRLSRARRIVENVFGIMASRFRILYSSINLSVDRIDLVVLTCCILHNFLRRNCSNTYNVEEMEAEDRSECYNLLPGLQPTSSRNAKNAAKFVREMFMDYFVGEGQVDWQEERI